MTVLFCHGLESGPVGRKSLALREAGFDVVAPDCRGLALADRLTVVEPALAALDRPVVVGSSYGGLVAVIAVGRARRLGQPIAGLVLCAPALERREAPADTERLVVPDVPTVVIHGLHDAIVPVEVGRTFAAGTAARFLPLDDDHGLSRSVDQIIAAVAEMLDDPRPAT